MKKLIILLSIILISISNIQSQSADRDKSFRLMSYNIHRGEGMDGKTDIERIGDVISKIKPEVVALQEVDSVVNRSGNINIIKMLAEQTGMYATFGYSILHDGGKYGNGVLTKEKPIAITKIAVPGKDEARTALIIELDKYVVINTHLSLTNEERLESVKIINETVKHYNKPLFLLGDLNAEPHEDPIKWLEDNDWQILTNIKTPTFPSIVPNVTIDYILGYKGKGRKYKVKKTEVIEEKIASDHRPIYVDVNISKSIK